MEGILDHDARYRMIVTVKVKPRAARRGVDVLADGSLMVRVTEPAQDGRANAAVIALLAAHFGVGTRAITILRGQSARIKRIDVAVSAPGARR